MNISIYKSRHINKRLTNRAFLLVGVLVYAIVFQWVYITWLNKYFNYYGFYYNPPELDYLILAFILSLLPGFLMPIRLTRPSQLIYWVLYLVVFIPSMFVPLNMALRPASDIVLLIITLCAGFFLTGASYLLPLPRLRVLPLPKAVFWFGFVFITLSLTAWVITVFFGQMRIVSFENIYKEVRFPADTIMTGSYVGYAIMWLSNVFNPLLISWGLVRKRLSFLIVGVLGQVLMYSTIGSKSAIVSIPLMFIFYFLLRKKTDYFGLKITWGVVSVFLILNSINLIMDGSAPFMMISSIIFMRIFGMEGLLAGQYHYFLQVHPLTFLSHINFVRLFLDYPYSDPLGIEIGHFYYNLNLNANANFWITDGLAGLGLPGILLVSLVCTFVFWLLDSAARGHSTVFVALLITLEAMCISNISLFTTLLSGGLGFCILILYLMPRKYEKGALYPFTG